jgi:hypothetical protein
VRIFDIDFYVINTAGEKVDMYWSPVLFNFSGPDVRSTENLYPKRKWKGERRLRRIGKLNLTIFIYVGSGDAFTSQGNATMSGASALFNVTHGGNGVFALMAPGIL